MSRIEVILKDGSQVVYGLDQMGPCPGYFFSKFDAEGEFISDMDTRPMMSLSGSEPVHRLTIVEEMKKYPEIPREHIDNIAGDLPPTGPRENSDLNLIIPDNGE